MCSMHYDRLRRDGQLTIIKPLGLPVMDRVWPRLVLDPSGCLLWQGSLSSGYGQVKATRSRAELLVHRLVYEHCVGPIPEGLELDHLCRVRRCANPLHLEPVTRQENVRRGTSPAAMNAKRVTCKRGHDEWRYNARGWRSCRACNRIQTQVRRAGAA